jgi:hypothetical protein
MMLVRLALLCVGIEAASLLVPQATGIERVAWLRGCWEARSPRRVIEEQWTAPRAHNMVSLSRTLRGDSLAAYEQIILRERGDRLEYEAHPSGQPVARFMSIAISDTMVVFENPAHDFPQRVGYQRRGADSLVAWIEGTMQGQARKIEFPYARATCG